MAKAQFHVLYRVFFLRVIDLELLASNGDPSRLMAQFANVFIMISIICSIPVLLMAGHRPPMASQWKAEHFFLETSITIAGLIAVLNWESAFPDRRDVLVLGPLPVQPGTLLLAKISALFAAPALAMATFNLFIGFAWPIVFISGRGGFSGALRAWPAYWLTLVLGGAFFVFSMLAIQGLAANLLPRPLFLQVSALLQAAMLCLLLSVYFLEPSLESLPALTSPANQRLLTWLPSYWFLGLFQQLNGSMHSALAPLARRAWIGLSVSGFGAGIAMLLSYTRMLPKIIEQPDILPGARTARWKPKLGQSLHGAIVLFSLRTLLRSRQHRTILSLYVGVGLAIVLGFLQTGFVGATEAAGGIRVVYLLASILTMILTVLAIRVVASIPISLRANWIMRVTQVRPAAPYAGAVRLSWLLLAVVPVLLALAAPLFLAYPYPLVLRHLATMLALGALVVEICLVSFPKISFTCSYMPGKANLHLAFWACLLFFIRWLKDGADIEGRMLQTPGNTALMILVLASLAGIVRLVTHLRTNPTHELLFEEEEQAELVTLKLT
jgi:hypothetical protein